MDNLDDLDVCSDLSTLLLSLSGRQRKKQRKRSAARAPPLRPCASSSTPPRIRGRLVGELLRSRAFPFTPRGGGACPTIIGICIVLMRHVMISLSPPSSSSTASGAVRRRTGFRGLPRSCVVAGIGSSFRRFRMRIIRIFRSGWSISSSIEAMWTVKRFSSDTASEEHLRSASSNGWILSFMPHFSWLPSGG